MMTRHHRTTRCATGIALLLLATAAAAQKPAPGLWEHQMTMKGGAGGEMDAAMARMKEEMARMPPEQRKAMEDMMKQRGMSIAPAAGGGQQMTARVCLTPEMVAKDEMPQQGGNCKQTKSQRSGNTVRFAFACTGDPASAGEGEFTFMGDKQHRGRTVVTTTPKGGKPERMEMEMQGRWLGADCGDHKPFVQPKR
jgi:hypothetical protein